MYPRGFWSAVLVSVSVPVYAEVSTGLDEGAKLPFWEWRNDNMSVRFVQRLPDQTRAYFLARGFKRQQAEMIAQSCVFQTVFRNVAAGDSGAMVEYDQTQWKVLTDSEHKGIKTREYWKPVWVSKGVSQSAQIAFHWSLLPTRQRYKPGDYNWGMTAFGVQPGKAFDVKISWKENRQVKTAVIPDIRCAADVHPDPGQTAGNSF